MVRISVIAIAVGHIPLGTAVVFCDGSSLGCSNLCNDALDTELFIQQWTLPASGVEQGFASSKTANQYINVSANWKTECLST